MQNLQEYYVLSPAIAKRVAPAYKIKSLDELRQIVQPADIMISYLSTKYLIKRATILGAVINKLLGLFQGSSFTSCKLIGFKNRIIGYSAKFKETKHKGVESNTIRQWFTKGGGGVVILRYPNITLQQQQIIVDYMKNRIGLEYNNTMMYDSLWSRITGRSKEALSPEEEQVYLINKKPLICSTIINFAYLKAGINLNFKKLKNNLAVWPKSFLACEDLEVVGLFEKK